MSDAFLLVGFHLPEFQTCQDPPHGSEKQAKVTKGRMRGRGWQLSRCLTSGKLLNGSQMKTLSYNPRRLELVDEAEVSGAPGGAEDSEAGAWAAQGNPGRQKCPAFPSDAVT